MIKIAIVEDDVTYSDQLTEYLHRYEVEYTESFDISTFTDGNAIVEGYHSQFDIILMDIEMRFMDGMSAAEIIRGIDKEVVIIFITAGNFKPGILVRNVLFNQLNSIVVRSENINTHSLLTHTGKQSTGKINSGNSFPYGVSKNGRCCKDTVSGRQHKRCGLGSRS